MPFDQSIEWFPHWCSPFFHHFPHVFYQFPIVTHFPKHGLWHLGESHLQVSHCAVAFQGHETCRREATWSNVGIHGIDHQQHHIWDVPVELCQLYVIICVPGKTIWYGMIWLFHIYVYPRVTMHNQKQISGPGRSLTHTPSLLVTSAYPWLYKHAQRWPKGHLQAESLGRSCMECLHCFHALMGFVSACLGGQQAAMPYFVFFFVALCHANQGLDRIKNKGMILPCSHVLYPNTNEQTKPTEKNYCRANIEQVRQGTKRST